MTDVKYHTLDTDHVQHFLDNIGGNEFSVIFLKKDGTQRKLTGTIDTSVTNRKAAVPVMCKESGMWKSFKLDQVLFISKK